MAAVGTPCDGGPEIAVGEPGAATARLVVQKTTPPGKAEFTGRDRERGLTEHAPQDCAAGSVMSGDVDDFHKAMPIVGTGDARVGLPVAPDRWIDFVELYSGCWHSDCVNRDQARGCGGDGYCWDLLLPRC